MSQIHYVCAECGAVNRLEQSRLADHLNAANAINYSLQVK